MKPNRPFWRIRPQVALCLLGFAVLIVSIACNFVTHLLFPPPEEPDAIVPPDTYQVILATNTPFHTLINTPTQKPTLTPEATETNLSRFEASECSYGHIRVAMDCGYLIAPEDHENPENGRTVRLPVAILHSKSENPHPDPLVYLSGGPGQNGIEPKEWLDFPFLVSRDIVLFDQRGTGNAEPNLNCPEYDKDKYAEETVVAKRCHARLLKEGINLALYNSTQNAADIHDLRLSLGYESWNILGISYGTRLALTVMRYHPQGIRSVILDSVFPPQVNALEEETINGARAFQVLFDSCAADVDCASHYPALEETLYKVIDKLNKNPAEWKDETFYGDDVVNIVFNALYDKSLIGYIPFVIYEARRSNYKPLQLLEDGSIVNEYRRRWEKEDITDSEGAFYSVECYEEVPFNNPGRVETNISGVVPQLSGALLADVESMFEVCALWVVEKAPAIENTPVQSDIPTLILTGQYDPITPPKWGKQASEYLPNSFDFEFAGIGHDTMDSHQCPVDIAMAFLEDPSQKPNDSCIADINRPSFYVP
jgi:pimeloyl-ACP methyl ester carboxylesterase